MPKYIVKECLDHNEKRYESGDTVEMTEEQAGALQSLGVLGGEIAGDSQGDEELIEKIKAAATAEEVEALVGKIKRKALGEAAAARKIELAG